MSLLYKEPKDVITSVEITQDNGIVKFEFNADCGKFGTDEPLAEFEITPKELLELLYTTSPIEFDAKKVAEEIFNKFWNKAELQEDEAFECVHIALEYSQYTPTQRKQILNELKKI